MLKYLGVANRYCLFGFKFVDMDTKVAIKCCFLGETKFAWGNKQSSVCQTAEVFAQNGIPGYFPCQRL